MFPISIYKLQIRIYIHTRSFQVDKNIFSKLDHIFGKLPICTVFFWTVSKLEAVDWRVDYILGSSELKDVNEPSVQLRLHIKNPDDDSVEPVSFNISADKFRILLSGELTVIIITHSLTQSTKVIAFLHV